MAAFSNQHHRLILDQFSQLPNTSTFSQFYLPESLQQIPIDVSVHQSAFLEKGTKVSQSTNHNELSVNNQSTDSSSVVDKLEIGEQVTQKVTHMAKKRKNKDGSSMSSVQFMDVARDVKGKKEKMKIKAKKLKAEKKDQKKVPQEEPTGFVHVRARRGQATDSHSLAERVRREKISERMKLLQALVPGCDKVTGKAFVLDEIINYVQSLKNQVEFLSMKLASESSMCYDFGMDLHELIIPAERLSSSSLVAPMPNVQQCNPAQTNAFSETTNTTFTSPNSYPLLDSSSSLLFDQQMKMLNILSQDNDGQLLWDEDDQRQKLVNQCGFINHLCSFY